MESVLPTLPKETTKKVGHRRGRLQKYLNNGIKDWTRYLPKMPVESTTLKEINGFIN